MLFYANSYGSHNVKYRDFSNPKKNREMKKEFEMQLKKNGKDLVNIAVNDDGKYYYRKFDNLQNFFQKLNDNDNSIFQLAKNNTRTSSRKPDLRPGLRPGLRPVLRIRDTRKPGLRKPGLRRPGLRKRVTRKPGLRKRITRKRGYKR